MLADMGSCEHAVMGLESRAVSTWVTKYLLLFLVKQVISSFRSI